MAALAGDLGQVCRYAAQGDARILDILERSPRL